MMNKAAKINAQTAKILKMRHRPSIRSKIVISPKMSDIEHVVAEGKRRSMGFSAK
jgi:hypothetical protein